MEKKKGDLYKGQIEEYNRLVKQQRLAMRVFKALQIVSPAANLVEKRTQRKQQIHAEIVQNKNSYKAIQQNIALSVAHRPLLVEKVSKNLSHNLD